MLWFSIARGRCLKDAARVKAGDEISARLAKEVTGRQAWETEAEMKAIASSVTNRNRNPKHIKPQVKFKSGGRGRRPAATYLYKYLIPLMLRTQSPCITIKFRVRFASIQFLKGAAE